MKAIEDFIKRNCISGRPVQVFNNSRCFGGNCFEVKIGRPGSESGWLYSYTVMYWRTRTLAEVLQDVFPHSQNYGGVTNFEEWGIQRDSYYERELGYEPAESYHAYCRRSYETLTMVLGKELYKELVAIAMGE